MNLFAFDIYMPSAWVEDGLLKPISSKHSREASRQSRLGKWAVKSAVLAISASAIIGTAVLPNLPNSVANAQPFASPYRPHALRPEEHIVPDHYWGRLGEAIKSAGHLPAQDASNDPPILV